MPTRLGLDDTLAAGDPGHITEHTLVARALNELYSIDAVSPGSGGTATPDVAAATCLTINMPGGNITIAAPTATGGIGPYPGQRLALIIVQDATGGRSITWNAIYKDVPPINMAANAVTVCEFANDGTNWRAVGREPIARAFQASKTWAQGQRVIGPSPYFGVWESTASQNVSSFDGWATGKWLWVGGSGIGTAANKPSATSGPDGYRYYSTDTQVWSTVVAGAWVNDPPGSGQVAAGPVLLTNAFDIQACGTTWTDITGASLSVPASTNKGIFLRAELCVVSNSGTAAVAALITPQIWVLDSGNADIDNGPGVASHSIVQVTAVNSVIHAKVSVIAYLAPPVSAATYKLRAKLRNAAPANWTSLLHTPDFGTGGGAGDMFYAVYG